MKAEIFINRHIIQANKKATKEQGKTVDHPAIAIKTYKGRIYAKTIEFTAGCRLIQNAEDARCSGATVWIQVDRFDSLIIDGVQAVNY